MPRDEQIKIELRPFQFDFVNQPTPTIVLAGNRGAGKTRTMLSLASKCTHIQRWFVLCGNDRTANLWAKALESSATVMVADDNTADAVFAMWEKIKAGQQELVRKYEYEGVEFPSSDILGFVMDDIGTFKKLSRSRMVNEIFSNGRQLQMLSMISPQSLSSMLTPEARDNTDYLITLRNPRRGLDYINKMFIGGELSDSQFVTLARTIINQKDRHGKKKHQSLVIDMGKAGESLDQLLSVYWHNAEEVPFESIRLGAPEWREYNKMSSVDLVKEQMEAKYKRDRLERYREQRFRAWNDYGVSSQELYEDDFKDTDDDHDYDQVFLPSAKRNQPSIQIVVPKHASSTTNSTNNNNNNNNNNNLPSHGNPYFTGSAMATAPGTYHYNHSNAYPSYSNDQASHGMPSYDAVPMDYSTSYSPYYAASDYAYDPYYQTGTPYVTT